jgi:hypothetical protein
MEPILQEFDKQAALMRKAIERVETKGYYITFAGLNQDGTDPRYIFNYFGGGLNQYLDTALALRGRRLVKVLVWLHDKGTRKDPDPIKLEAIRTGRLFDYPFGFKAILPDRKAYMPIITALELMSKKKVKTGKRSYEFKGSGFLNQENVGGRAEFVGHGREPFETVLRVLEMPHHRAILLGGK